MSYFSDSLDLRSSYPEIITGQFNRVRKKLKQVAKRKIKADNTSEIALTALDPTSCDSEDVQAVGARKTEAWQVKGQSEGRKGWN